MSRNIGISKSVVQRILKSNKMHAYHYTKVQNLWPEDYARRINFCNWILQRNLEEPGFVHKILFSDESLFTREGCFNTHNYHVWSDENPHSTMFRNFQRRFKINLWAGIFNNKIIGPFEFPRKINSRIYNNFLQNELPILLEDIPLNQRQEMIFQQDGAPPHYGRNVREYLDRMFPGKWIGRGGPHNWPPRSPDLTILDFFVWGYIKEYVYRKRVNNREELQERIMEAIGSITEDMIRNAGNNLLRRARLCLEAGGGHFEHLL